MRDLNATDQSMFGKWNRKCSQISCKNLFSMKHYVLYFRSLFSSHSSFSKYKQSNNSERSTGVTHHIVSNPANKIYIQNVAKKLTPSVTFLKWIIERRENSDMLNKLLYDGAPQKHLKPLRRMQVETKYNVGSAPWGSCKVRNSCFN